MKLFVEKKEPKCTQIVEKTPVLVSTPMLRHRFCLAVNVETISLGAIMLFMHFPQVIIMVFCACSPNSGDCICWKTNVVLCNLALALPHFPREHWCSLRKFLIFFFRRGYLNGHSGGYFGRSWIYMSIKVYKDVALYADSNQGSTQCWKDIILRWIV